MGNVCLPDVTLMTNNFYDLFSYYLFRFIPLAIRKHVGKSKLTETTHLLLNVVFFEKQSVLHQQFLTIYYIIFSTNSLFYGLEILRLPDQTLMAVEEA